MPDKAFESFWESTGGKPGAYHNYCYQGWRAGIEYAEEKLTTTNTLQAEIAAYAHTLQCKSDNGIQVIQEIIIERLQQLSSV